jgi:hypothetical protein
VCETARERDRERERERERESFYYFLEATISSLKHELNCHLYFAPSLRIEIIIDNQMLQLWNKEPTKTSPLKVNIQSVKWDLGKLKFP